MYSYNTFIVGEEFRALFLSTTEPVDSFGNTTNSTKSPCDPYVFNTVLTRSKSLVVVVGSPIALLEIEEHMVGLYGKKARCWSNYLRICLENDTFIIPPTVEPVNITAKQFELRLKAKLFDKEVSRLATQLADSIAHVQINTHHQKQKATPALKQSSAVDSMQPSRIPTSASASAVQAQSTPSAKSASTKKPFTVQQPKALPENLESFAKLQEQVATPALKQSSMVDLERHPASRKPLSASASAAQAQSTASAKSASTKKPFTMQQPKASPENHGYLPKLQKAHGAESTNLRTEERNSKSIGVIEILTTKVGGSILVI